MGDRAFMLNTDYFDGTRLRARPHADEFNGQFVPNDQQVEILALEGGFSQVCSCGEGVTDETRVEGWVRTRNISAVKRAVGLKPSLLTKAASSGPEAMVSAAPPGESAISVAGTSSTHGVEELKIDDFHAEVVR